jgi:G:T-mismatch repair DNA endonuclease (very short patch repair protein)
VIDNATGLHRSDEFKKGQSVRTKAAYDKIDGLREQRGKLFSQCWKDGRNHFRVKKNKKSKEEKEIFAYLNALGKYTISDDEVCIGGNKFLAPDMIINGKVIVEFYGDYFHANPLMHKAEEYIVKKGMTAQQLWEEDSKRQKMLEDVGYSVIVVWQYDFRRNREETLSNLVKEIDLKLKGETI